MRIQFLSNAGRRLLTLTALASSTMICHGQQGGGTTPADSIELAAISAHGNLATGQVEVSMDLRNGYHQPALVHLVLGGFEGLGLTDDKGNKYKIHTSDQLMGTQDINKGYINIPFVQFGDKQFKSFTYVEQKLAPGETRKLIIRIPKVPSGVASFKEIFSHRQISINYGLVSDQVVKLPAVNIAWSHSLAKQ